MMAKHSFRFFADDGTPRAVGFYGPFLRDLLDVLVDACQQATRLRIEGRSTAPGIVPGWLERASAFDLVDMQESEIILGARPLRENDAWKTCPRRAVSEIDVSLSCLDIMEESLDDALHGRMESDRYDRNLIGTLEAFSRLSRHGISCIDVVNGRTLRVDKRAIEAVRQLRARIPDDRRIIVAGKLDTIRHSDRAFSLLLDSGDSLHGIAGETVDAATLGALFGKTAMVSGIAKFRPSGKVLHVEAERIEPAVGDVSVWSYMPKPFDGPMDPHWGRVPGGSSWSLESVFGQIQIEETDEEFARAVEDLS